MISFSAIGTEWSIELPDVTPENEARIQQKILARIEAFDKNYSRFRDDSLISEMARTAGTYTLPDDAQPLFDLYYELYQATDGLVTPLIGQVLEDAGYDKDYSLVPKELSTPKKWEEVIDYNYPEITLHEPALLDLGAIGKGYLIDIIAELIKDEGIEYYVLNAGGDIRCATASETPCVIGLEDPNDIFNVLGTVTILEGSICGSAGNRRAWDRFHHIINPATLESPRSVTAVWVYSAEARIADALTTCLYLMPAEEIIPKLLEYSFEYFILRPDYTFEQSQEFNAVLFTQE